MSDDSSSSLILHLEALRNTLISCFLVTALIYPIAFWATPFIIDALVHWCFPESLGKLHYFAPMEVFWVQLKMALILALALAYPWNMYQLWKFFKPALYQNEQRAIRWWIVFSSILFFSGMAFCLGVILPLLMNFAASFASDGLSPMIGLGQFLGLATWLMLAFGVMFQSPIVVLLCVRFGIVSAETLRQKRPYVVVIILVLSAILTPPDVVSQIMLGLPTWLLFELGLFLSKLVAQKNEREAGHE